MEAFLKALMKAGKIFQVGTSIANRISNAGGYNVPHTPQVAPFFNKRW